MSSISLPHSLKDAMPADQWRLRSQLRNIEQDAKNGKQVDVRIAKLVEQLKSSVEIRQRRRDRLPKPTFDTELPVCQRREEIADAIRDNQVVILCGETGSGKSTQLPKICLTLGRGVDGIIGHTQPRRVAARAVATRVAEELGTTLGKGVGFKIRFTDQTSDTTYVKLMTDGILLAETQHDRFLNQYDTIIIDEAHERSLNIDFLLGYLKRLLPKRPDLRIIITSATIDAARFAEFFGSEEDPAPVIEVSGRTYPVEVRYRPHDGEDDDYDVTDGIASSVDELLQEGPGDILVFLSTEREIRDVSKTLKGHFQSRRDDAEILPLYARLSASEQAKIFQAHKKQRVILATNVAESSITVPGVKYVIDTGLARISRYSPRSKIQRLPIEPISRASADQRKGRCGRVAAGICIRLYAEDDYLKRDEYTTPEIRRTNLAAVILQTLANRLGRIDEFPFLDPPRLESIRDGYKTLMELGAIDGRRDLTTIGRKLSRLPVDPRIGRMILAADDENAVHEVLIIAAALEVQDPRERPQQNQAAADAAHQQWTDGDSDFLSLLKLWDFNRHLKETVSRNQLRKACRQNFLNYNRMREWLDVHRQLLKLVRQADIHVGPRQDDSEAIHRSLLYGLLSNIAMKNDRHDYQCVAGAGFYLWPGSGLMQKKPKWVMASELVETTRRYLRTAGKINPDWIEGIAPHLVKKSYSDPHWSKKAQTVVAYEKVTLYGLTVVAGRRANYGPIDPIVSRDLFIQAGLAE
ncbi:MAG: ATP-dependent helicase HrpA, partial [Pirellulaceae bacterium]